uniref:Uncharacterized protein n=1 Tax=Oryza barthii TaxID=65489 RepID=A0A0D3GMN7_9ORYZ
MILYSYTMGLCGLFGLFLCIDNKRAARRNSGSTQCCSKHQCSSNHEDQ